MEEEEQNPKNSLFINPLEGYNEQRQQAIDTGAQFVDKVVTGGLEKINMPGAEFIGDRARNISGFTADMLIPEDWEIPIMGAAAAIPLDGPLGEAAIYGGGVANRIRRAAKGAKKASLANLSNVVDDAFSSANSLFNRGQPGWRLATANGADVGQELAEQSATPMLSKGSNQPNLPGVEYAYNFPVRKRFPWENNPRKIEPPVIGETVDLVDDPLLNNVARKGTKQDIDLSNFNWEHPDSYRQFELAMNDIIQADDIAANEITRLGYRGSSDITKLTKQKGVSQIYYDYLNAYFNRWIATGIESDFSKASKLVLPDGKTIQGSQQLARDLRRYYMNPELFGNKGFKAGSKEYKEGIADIVEAWQLGGKGIQTKWAAHHLNVIDEAWPLFVGLKPDEVAVLRKRLEKAGLFSGDDPKNLKYLPKEVHDKVHGIFWKKHRPPWAGKLGIDHAYRQLMTNKAGFNTTKAREARVKEYIAAYKKVDQDLNLYIQQFLLNNKGIDMKNPDAIVDFLDSINPPPGF